MVPVHFYITQVTTFFRINVSHGKGYYQPPCSKASKCKNKRTKQNKKLAALRKVDVVLACSVEVRFLKGRDVQGSLNLSVLNARKFYNFHTIVMSRCRTSDILRTQDQVNSVKHKRRKVYNGSGPYALRIDLFSNE